MLEATSTPKPFFTATSAYSLAAVGLLVLLAQAAATACLPKNAKRADRLTFIWLVRVPHAANCSRVLNGLIVYLGV
jgi:hypothetical protein